MRLADIKIVRAIPSRAILIALALLLLGPIIILFVASIFTESEFFPHFVSTLLPRYLLNTLGSIILVAISTGILGVSTAWLATRYRFPLRGAIQWLLILPLGMPSYISAYAYVGLLGYGGPARNVLGNIFGGGFGESVIPDFGGLSGLVFILTFALYPYVYVVMRSAFQQQPLRFYDSAATTHRRSQLLWKVGLRLGRPALAGGMSLVVMETLNEYGAAFYLGVDTFSTGLIHTWTLLYDTALAVKLAGALLLFAVIIITLERIARGKAKFEGISVDSHRMVRKLKTIPGIIAMLFCMIPIIAGFALPLGMLIYWARYANIGMLAGLASSAVNSLALMAAVVVLTLSIAICFSSYSKRCHDKFGERVSRFATLGYSLPGAVVGMTLLLLARYTSASVGQFIVSVSAIGLIYACVIRYVAVAYYPLQGSAALLYTRFYEAARSMGVGNWKIFWSIDMRLLYRATLGAGLLVATDILKELPITVLLRPLNFDTLALSAFRLADEERLIEASLPALLLLAIVSLLLMVAHPLLERRKRSHNRLNSQYG